jgi:hypothetical protein
MGICREFSIKLAVLLEMRAKVKYLSKWWSNPLALTIYVNANELQSSPVHQRPFAPRLHEYQATFHPRG